MTNPIIQAVLDHLPARKKTIPSGWTTFNAVCCHHRGETVDKRQRGGIKMAGPNQVSYHCFNCGFKTGYTEGHTMGFKFRKLLSWLGVEDQTIELLKIEALRQKQNAGDIVVTYEPRTELQERELPPDVVLLSEHASEFPEQATYITGRGYELTDFPFLVTKDEEYRMNKRVIIPFIVNNRLVGYTARLIEPGTPKYYSQHDPACVFGISDQQHDAKWVTLTEGPMDAICLGGVAVLGGEVREEQAEQIDALGKRVIVVPDRNKPGMAMHETSLLTAAIDYGWAVAFPQWETDIIDVNQAVRRYGRLYVVRSILESATSNPTKIKLMRKLHKFAE